jgi:GntR family transcriptional regulator
MLIIQLKTPVRKDLIAMEIAIRKGIHISLHQQLVTQISMQIAAGILKPGVKLPSIRALSQKLDIHHNTCLGAYRELEATGLIEIRHGSGARVALIGHPVRQEILSPKTSEPTGLEALAQFFVRQALQQGYPWEEALAALENSRRELSREGCRPLVFVDIHSDILGVFQAELQDALNRPVQAVSLNRLNPDTERFSHFLVSRYHYQALREKLAAAWAVSPDDPSLNDGITVIDVGAVKQELDFIRQLPEGSLVTVVSVSTIILQQAEAVISALRGGSLITRTILAGQEPPEETQRVLRRAHVIFADWICAPQLESMTRKTIHTIRTIPPHELGKLQAFQNTSQ